MRIFTIGHSIRTFDELAQTLVAHNVNILVDVRSFPRSIRNPQFNKDTIDRSLAELKIRYVWLQKLGGRRKGLGKESRNTCWKNKSFRNYADYMETSAFKEGAEEVLQLAREGEAAIMCAESLYWRCHRSMISDFLKSKEVEVIHIIDSVRDREHEYSRCAKLVDGQLSYR